MGKFFPARADGGVVAKAAEEQFDFGEGKAHVAVEADEQGAIEGIAWVAALAAGAMRRGEKTHFLVVADGGSIEAGAGGEFTDFNFVLLFPKRGAAGRAQQCRAPTRDPQATSLSCRILLDLKLTLTFSIWEWDVANPYGGKP